MSPIDLKGTKNAMNLAKVKGNDRRLALQSVGALVKFIACSKKSLWRLALPFLKCPSEVLAWTARNMAGREIATMFYWLPEASP